jgi:hypothetical protein
VIERVEKKNGEPASLKVGKDAARVSWQDKSKKDRLPSWRRKAGLAKELTGVL